MKVTIELDKLASWLELPNTIQYMISTKRQERLKGEILQLAIRKKKLEFHLDRYKDWLDKSEQDLLKKQLQHMSDYLDVLLERVKHELTL